MEHIWLRWPSLLANLPAETQVRFLACCFLPPLLSPWLESLSYQIKPWKGQEVISEQKILQLVQWATKLLHMAVNECKCCDNEELVYVVQNVVNIGCTLFYRWTPAVYHCTMKLFSQTTGSDTWNDLRIQNSAKNGRTPINKLDRSHFITSKTKVCHAFKRKLILNKISHLLGQSPSLLDRYSTESSASEWISQIYTV